MITCELTAYNQTNKSHHGGLVVSVLDSRACGPGLSPGRGHCVEFLVKTLYSHSVSLHPGVMGTGEFNAEGYPGILD